MDATVAAWRKQQRTKLLARRKAMSPEERRSATRIVAEQLDTQVTASRAETIGLYWPINQEMNFLSWANARSQRDGLVLCLPVVVTRNAPLEYWRWREGEPLARGIWDIPIPAHRDVVVPDLMLAPMVGFDHANYRLGYGGGYFDRTLASFHRRPIVIGIGYAFGALETIFPQPHDIPMDVILTDRRTDAD